MFLRIRIILCLFLSLLVMSAIGYSFYEAPPEPIAKILSSYSADEPDCPELPVVSKHSQGYIRCLIAPPGGSFKTSNVGSKSISPESVVLSYVEENLEGFTSIVENIQFDVVRVKPLTDEVTVVWLEERYYDLPVFASGVKAWVTREGKITALVCEILRNPLSNDKLSSLSKLPVDEVSAMNKALDYLSDRYHISREHVSQWEASYIAVYDPSMVKRPGSPTVVYVLTLFDNVGKTVNRILVDAFSGEIRLEYPLKQSLLNREVYDAKNTFAIPLAPSRREGDEPTGIPDVDLAYDYLGDAYDFFFKTHRRDSYDNEGSHIRAIVRLPIQNAFWDPELKGIGLGIGFVVDDVVGHEYSHGVVDSQAGLIYFGESGAIVESLCDMWGEFIDLTNSRGVDTPEVKWLLGEELPPGATWENSKVSAIRSMKDPTIYSQPDRYNSPLFIKDIVLALDDYGGVHTNSGVGNKLAYLLAEGDTFNNETVRGFGITRTSKLFYGALDLLPPFADYSMLALALNASAVLQGMSIEDRVNISNALRAVEILPAEVQVGLGAYAFRATAVMVDDKGTPGVLLTWTPPPDDQYQQVVIVRKEGSYPGGLVDGQQIYIGKGNRFVDVNVFAGIEYYYGLFIDMVNLPPVELYDMVIPGFDPPSVLTQEFNVTNPRESATARLAYSQLMFIPTGKPVNDLGNNKFSSGYYHYDVVYTPEVFSFPVSRRDSTGYAYAIPMSTDGLVSFNLTDVQFPFFGKRYGTLYVGSNGYITFIPLPLDNPYNFPSLASHFAIPRISFLFSDLAPDSAGQVWTRQLPDRFVITFENVPKNASGNVPNPYSGASPGSSVQVELFFSGHIRITYLQLDTNYAVVGLSDGRGVPVDVSQAFPQFSMYSVNRYVNFIQLPNVSPVLHFTPHPVYYVYPGQRLSFDVRTMFVGDTIPYLYASWLRNEVVPFADKRNGSGTFVWTPKREDVGIHYVRVTARQGNQYAYIDIPIVIQAEVIKPKALNLRISSNMPAEDTSASRAVPAGRPLNASYDYIHPLMLRDPQQYAEGVSLLYWFRNHEIVPALTNYRTVPPNVTVGGDIWYFRVIPVAINGVVGDEVISPIIYVVGQPKLLEVSPNKGSVSGGDKVILRGKDLLGILSIQFGGVEVVGYKYITNTEVEVITPQHLPGKVDIYIKTVGGAMNFPDMFEYTEPIKPDEGGGGSTKPSFIISCGVSSGSTGYRYLSDIIVLLGIVGLLVQKGHYNKVLR